MITTYECFVPPIMGFGASKRIGIALHARGHKKAFVIYDKGMEDFGIAPPIVENLHMSNIETVCFDEVVPDPPDEMVEHAAEIARTAGCDVIVAIGGGSSMDTAKGVNVLINNPPPIRQYFGVPKGLRPGLPMVFVPTTAGTGSETTNMCVISCVSQNKKDSVVSPVCLGSLAILDPELTLGLPPRSTAMTGIDAFAHAVESLTGGQANPLSDALARDAIHTITRWLPRAVENGKDPVAREKMLEASYFAGMAFTNALVHLGHSIGHTIGARFHVPHGLACAFCLPEVIEYTAWTEKEKVEMICEEMGGDGARGGRLERGGRPGPGRHPRPDQEGGAAQPGAEQHPSGRAGEAGPHGDRGYRLRHHPLPHHGGPGGGDVPQRVQRLKGVSVNVVKTRC